MEQSVSTGEIKFTYEDYLHLPEHKRYEIIEGELSMVPSPGRTHQEILGNINELIRGFILERDLGKIYFAPFDVIFSDIDICQPDLVFVSKERMNIVAEEGIRGAPDLIVEIVSPSSEYRDRGWKKKLYAKNRVEEYWLVDPLTETIEVMALKGSGYETDAIYRKGEVLTSPLLEGLTMDLERVFASS